MRIVIDLQGAQAENKKRGIGRYALSLTKAIIKNCGEHDIIIALNGALTESIEPIRSMFDGLLASDQILVWSSPGTLNYLNDENNWDRECAELVREAFLTSLEPDCVIVTSLFEGITESAVTSIHKLNKKLPTAVVLYDLIPFLNRKPYLDNPAVANWYDEKIEYLQNADLLLAISESTRQEGIQNLNFLPENIVKISTAADPQFHKKELTDSYINDLMERYSLFNNFVMYTGGIDHRKNVEGLIRAFSKLSIETRKAHQLVIVCSIQDADAKRLKKLAMQLGLSDKELVLTGFVSEDDLTGLYNLCKLFVFPSKHEGFGLPALEAMSCGKAVIGGNTSSLPEVIGYDEALFDSYDDKSITAKLEQALTDDDFRCRLEKFAMSQAKKFSWDKTAIATIQALELLDKKTKSSVNEYNTPTGKPKLAYLSPLPPQRSGISDYSAELIPSLVEYYDVDVILTCETDDVTWNHAKCKVRNVNWFRKNANKYDRVLYHFGNSEYHHHMFELLEEIPGVVVLHDFFLSGIVAHMDVHYGKSGSWAEELYRSHGYFAFKERFTAKDSGDVVFKYPCNFSVLQNSLGIIVHSVGSSRLAMDWYPIDFASLWAEIPLLRISAENKLCIEEADYAKLGLDKSDFIVSSFGLLGKTKLNRRLLDAWIKSPLSKNKRCKLIFVGENSLDKYGEDLLNAINNNGLSKQIIITGWVDTAIFHQYLSISDLAVQLRTLSRGETSAAVLDCMNYGVATIVNANGNMAYLPDDGVHKLKDNFSDTELADALVLLWHNSNQRKELGNRAKQIIHTVHAPKVCAQKYNQAIENFTHKSASNMQDLIVSISELNYATEKVTDLARLSQAIDLSIPRKHQQKQLFVDVSELVKGDSKTGIQRVVRSILQELIINPPVNIRVEPVYATTTSEGYIYARQFTTGFMDCPTTILKDEAISFKSGDIFLGLDYQPHTVPAQREFFEKMRRYGVKVCFVVYDLLCLELPQYFFDGASSDIECWLDVVTENDCALCISNATADVLTRWVNKEKREKPSPVNISWFHLGADIRASSPTNGFPEDHLTTLSYIKGKTSFLMVGTVEPRKGHALTLTAFEELWNQGIDINLVIVGKHGWDVDQLAIRLKSHKQRNKKLFWLESISDEYLEEVYSACSCLIASSEGEGFGLPLIEAAQHKLPIIARDIPVFREVAGEYAFYFGNLFDPYLLSNIIVEWMSLYEKGVHPSSETMPWLTWKKSANGLLNTLIREEGNFE